MTNAKLVFAISGLMISSVLEIIRPATAADPTTLRDIDVTELYDNPTRQRAYVTAWIKHTFPDTYPTMLTIARCETQLMHWDTDGTLLPNNTGTSSAAGAFQILLELHEPDIEDRELDMNNMEDYMQFVRYLHDRHSNNQFRDWEASQHCWDERQYVQNDR